MKSLCNDCKHEVETCPHGVCPIVECEEYKGNKMKKKNPYIGMKCRSINGEKGEVVALGPDRVGILLDTLFDEPRMPTRDGFNFAWQEIKVEHV